MVVYIIAEHLTRVYISKTASTAHLLDRAISGRRALCGLMPASHLDEDWYGTGSQLEHERAATLPLCKRCGAVLGPRYAQIGGDA